MLLIVRVVALSVALGLILLTPKVRAERQYGEAQREPLSKQWQTVQNTFTEALQGLLKVLPGTPDSQGASSGSRTQYRASSSSYGNPKGSSDLSIEKAINSHAVYLPDSSSSSSGSGAQYGGPSSSYGNIKGNSGSGSFSISGGNSGKISGSDGVGAASSASGAEVLLPQIVKILEGKGGGGYRGQRPDFTPNRGQRPDFTPTRGQRPDITPNAQIIPSVVLNLGGNNGGYESSSGGATNPGPGYGVPAVGYGAPSSGLRPSGFRPQQEDPLESYGPPSPGGGYPASSNPAGSQYGASLDQIVPSGYSQTEPPYGVPPPPEAGSQISQMYGTPGQDLPPAPPSGGYPGPLQAGPSFDGGFQQPSGIPSGPFGGPNQFPPGFDSSANFPPPLPEPPRQIFVDTVASLPEHPSGGNSPQQYQQQQEPEHHNIIFVKAPMPPQVQTQVILPPQNHLATQVYVLTKQVDENDNDIKFIAPRPTAPSQPEVFFVRYAANAPKEPISPFNRALEDIPPLPQNFDVYAPQMSSGYSVKKREVEVSTKPKTIYTLRINKQLEQKEQEEEESSTE